MSVARVLNCGGGCCVILGEYSLSTALSNLGSGVTVRAIAGRILALVLE